MLSGQVQGRYLSLISKMIQPKAILEIGTYTGYSAICLAEGLQSGGKLITIDINEELQNRVRNYFKESDYDGQIDFRIGDARKILPTLNETFDLVFIDADKPPYPTYLEWALKLTRPGSIIVADNCIRGGKPLREPVEDDPATRGLSEYDQRIATDPRLVSVAFPMDDNGMDGFAISVVRPVTSEGDS